MHGQPGRVLTGKHVGSTQRAGRPSVPGSRRCPSVVPAAQTKAGPPSQASTPKPVPSSNGNGSSSAASPTTSRDDGSRAARSTSPGADKSRVKAVAAKISAARELARRLAEEKQAAMAASARGGGSQPEKQQILRGAEEAAAAAAVQAARADSLARALDRAETGREQLKMLKTENEALRELLMELASDRAAAQQRLQELQKNIAAMVAKAAPEDTLTSIALDSIEASGVRSSLTTPVKEEKPAPTPPTAKPKGIATPAAKPAAPPPPPAVKPPAVEPKAKVAEAPAAPAAPVKPPAAKPPVAPPAPAAPPKPAAKTAKPAAAAPPAAPPTAPPAPAPKPAAVPPPVAPPTKEAAAPAAVPAAAQAPAQAPPEAPPAPPAVVEPEVPPPPPEPQPPSVMQLQQSAAAARTRGLAYFSFPDPAPVGQRVWIYYNRAAGPLRGSNPIRIKMGLNKWETITNYDLKPCPELATSEGDWWCCQIDLEAELFRADFVVEDTSMGMTDNNRSRDFTLTLVGGPTEAELLEMRAEAYAQAEAARRAMIQQEEDRLWAEVQRDAKSEAAIARAEYRQKREAELRAAAQKAVADKRAVRAHPAAADSVSNTYQWMRGESGAAVRPKVGEAAVLLYNCSAGPLGFTNRCKVLIGFDGWAGNKRTTYEMSPLSNEEIGRLGLPRGSWCKTPLIVMPLTSHQVDFVFCDQHERVWDNNRQQDFHTVIEQPPPRENEVDLMYESMKAESAAADKQAEELAAQRAAKHVESRAMVARKRRAAQQEFLYTLPLTPQAGQDVELFYNPDRTPLRGRPEIYVRGGFNRWRHGTKINPTRMTPVMPGGIGFQKCTIQIPPDVAVMDFVLSDSAADAGGFWDNNGGLDYHINVEGGPLSARPRLKVVHIAVEMAPIAKVGGMGDVVTALARAVQEDGHEVEVLCPKYDVINYGLVKDLRHDGGFNWGGTHIRVWRGLVENVHTVFLEPENGLFWVGCIYGRNDDASRFNFFCNAALEYLKIRNVQPSIVHCHDWQSAPAVWGDKGRASSVFTIHNLNYGADLVGRAMAAVDVATTVSPTYAREIAGHPAVAPHLGKLFGVLNGIDQEIWDPATDPFLPINYGPEGVVAGKAAARKELRFRMGLADIDVPVVAVVTRLVHQKGIHLIKHAAWRTLERGGEFVLLGSAPDPRVQGEFNALRDQLRRMYPDRACLWFEYNEPLSHLIYAGSDMFLVPSMFEPCGLTQMIAMRYGSVPVVRRTGGLNDTVFDVDHDEDRAHAAGLETNGFSFDSTDAAGMDYALNRALSAFYSDRDWWNGLASRIMRQDWSWANPSLDYIELYWKALKRM